MFRRLCMLPSLLERALVRCLGTSCACAVAGDISGCTMSRLGLGATDRWWCECVSMCRGVIALNCSFMEQCWRILRLTSASLETYALGGVDAPPWKRNAVLIGGPKFGGDFQTCPTTPFFEANWHAIKHKRIRIARRTANSQIRLIVVELLRWACPRNRHLCSSRGGWVCCDSNSTLWLGEVDGRRARASGARARHPRSPWSALRRPRALRRRGRKRRRCVTTVKEGAHNAPRRGSREAPPPKRRGRSRSAGAAVSRPHTHPHTTQRSRARYGPLTEHAPHLRELTNSTMSGKGGANTRQGRLGGNRPPRPRRLTAYASAQGGPRSSRSVPSVAIGSARKRIAARRATPPFHTAAILEYLTA